MLQSAAQSALESSLAAQWLEPALASAAMVRNLFLLYFLQASQKRMTHPDSRIVRSDSPPTRL